MPTAPAPKPTSKLSLSNKILLIFVLSLVAQLVVFFVSDNRWLSLLSSITAITLFLIFIEYELRPLKSLLDNIKQQAQNNPHLLPPNVSHNEFSLLSGIFKTLETDLTTSNHELQLDQKMLDVQKQKFESMINAISDGVVAVDPQGKIMFMNSVALHLTNLKIEEANGQPLQTLIQLRDSDGIPVPLDKIFKDPAMAKETLKMITKNSQADVKITAATSVDKSVMQYMLVLHDMAKEKALMGIQIDFVSMASHELRTPLTSIIGYLSVFVDENKQKLTKENLEFLDRVMISAKQLSALIDNLIAVSKVERKAFSVNTSMVDWPPMVKKSVEDNRIAGSQKQIIVNFKPPTNPLPKISVDPVRINEVLNNLISNAVNYTQNGGTIEVGTYQDKDQVITYIKDNGRGIPKDAQQHLFTKFFRVQGALDTSSNSKGTGLGLYLSKSIVDLHHGKIWVESEEGHGATFYFSLPIISDEVTLKPNIAPIPNIASLTLPS